MIKDYETIRVAISIDGDTMSANTKMNETDSDAGKVLLCASLISIIEMLNDTDRGRDILNVAIEIADMGPEQRERMNLKEAVS